MRTLPCKLWFWPYFLLPWGSDGTVFSWQGRSRRLAFCGPQASVTNLREVLHHGKGHKKACGTVDAEGTKALVWSGLICSGFTATSPRSAVCPFLGELSLPTAWSGGEACLWAASGQDACQTLGTHTIKASQFVLFPKIPLLTLRRPKLSWNCLFRCLWTSHVSASKGPNKWKSESPGIQWGEAMKTPEGSAVGLQIYAVIWSDMSPLLNLPSLYTYKIGTMLGSASMEKCMIKSDQMVHA